MAQGIAQALARRLLQVAQRSINPPSINAGIRGGSLVRSSPQRFVANKPRPFGGGQVVQLGHELSVVEHPGAITAMSGYLLGSARPICRTTACRSSQTSRLAVGVRSRYAGWNVGITAIFPP